MVYFFDRLCRDLEGALVAGLWCDGRLAVLTHYFMGLWSPRCASICCFTLRAHRGCAGVVRRIGGGRRRDGRLACSPRARADWWRECCVGVTWQGFVERLAPAQGMLAEIRLWRDRRLPPEWWMAFIAVLVVVGLLVAIFGHRWRTLRPGGAWLLPAWLIVPPLLVTLVPERLEARYNAAILPAYCLLLALAVIWLWKWSNTRGRSRRWSLGLVLYAQVTPLIPTMNVVKSDYGHVVAYLRRHARPGDALILNGDWQWVQQCITLRRQIFANQHVLLPPRRRRASTRSKRGLCSKRRSPTSKRIWVLPTAVEQADPKRFVAGWLNEHAYLTSELQGLDALHRARFFGSFYSAGSAGELGRRDSVRKCTLGHKIRLCPASRCCST